MNSQAVIALEDTPLREIFLKEVTNLCDQLQGCVDDIAASASGDRAIREVERIAMDLKGVTSVVGLYDIADAMHDTEKASSLLILRGEEPPEDYLSGLEDTLGVVRSLIGELEREYGLGDASQDSGSQLPDNPGLHQSRLLNP